jgi:hypothetical protein
MSQVAHDPLLLRTALPGFCEEVKGLLEQENESGLASQVADLLIVDRCRCGDDFCATFYTQPKPDGAYGPGHRCLEVEPKRRMIILDVLGEKIAQVEMLYRDEIRAALIAALP